MNRSMYKILLTGSIGAGKTTLTQRLSGMPIEYAKTQSIQAGEEITDTPGEYFDHRVYWSALRISSNNVDRVLLLADPTDHDLRIPPGIATTFPRPVTGVVTKKSLATPEQLEMTEWKLQQGGVDRVFVVDSITGEGIDDLVEVLECAK